MRAKITVLTLGLLVLLLALPAGAANKADVAAAGEITYHKDIEPILQHNCQGCHRPDGASYGGMIAPMSLTSYEEVRPWVKSIAKNVMAREMPPWFAADEFHGVFANERTLSDEEIQTIVAWAKAGAPKGDPADAPPPTKWTSHEGWMIGEPDLILDLAEPFWIEDDVVDVNISLRAEEITEEMLPEPRWIAAVEFRPGSDAVHHIIGSSRAQEAEAPGATGMFGGIAPGTEPFVLPDGVGRLLMPGSDVWFQMHYNKEPGEGTGRWDHSQIAFKFHPKDAEIERVATWEAIGNRDFEIPPQVEGWEVGASKIFEHETTVYGYLPHMHLRGAYAKYTAFYPDGTQEVLLEVPEYDWNWQANYEYEEPRVIPAGTRIEVLMKFDNTPERRDAIVGMTINPERTVRFGGPTTDEMALGWIDYAEHKPVDMSVLETPSGGR